MTQAVRRVLQAGCVAASITLVAAGCATRDGSTRDAAPAKCDVDQDSPGVSDTSIKLGAFTPLSGAVGALGQAAVDGENLAFDAVNSDGGIQGRQIEFIAYDDVYDPSKSPVLARKLVQQDKVLALVGSVGTPNYQAAIPFLESQKTISIAPYAPSNNVGTLDVPHTYSIWTNFIDEASVTLGWALENRNVTKVAGFFLKGDVGDNAKIGVERTLAEAGLKLDTSVSVTATQTDFSAVAQTLKDSGADTVVGLTTPQATGQILAAMHKIGYEPQHIGNSDLSDPSFVDGFKLDNNGSIVGTKTLPFDDANPLMQKFVSDWKAEQRDEPTVWAAVGYAQAQVAIQALKTAEALTPSCLEASLQGMKDFDMGILPPISFGPDQRQGIRGIGVAEIKDGSVTQLVPFQVITD